MSQQKLAVAMIHGIGVADNNFDSGISQEPTFFQPTIQGILANFAAELEIDESEARSRLAIEPIYWANLVQEEQDQLWEKINSESLNYGQLRFFFVAFLGDTVAYQITSQKDRTLYDRIHRQFSQGLKNLAQKAGSKAPLCVISHSLGSVIASNYFYDLQQFRNSADKQGVIPELVKSEIGDTALELGETLQLFYTLGSPLALWSLHQKFDRPIRVPAADLQQYYPGLFGEWINFYDDSDVIAYPLKPISPEYEKAVTADKSVNVGSVLTSWNPLAHLYYWNSEAIAREIARRLAKTWQTLNQG